MRNLLNIYLQKTTFKSIPISPTISSEYNIQSPRTPTTASSAARRNRCRSRTCRRARRARRALPLFFEDSLSKQRSRLSLLSLLPIVDPASARRLKRLPQFQPSVLAGGALVWLRTAPIQTASVPRAHLDNKLLPSLCLYETKTFLTTSSSPFPYHDLGIFSFSYIVHL